MRKGKIIHKWNRPKEIDRELSDLLIKTGRDMLPRLILVMGIILLSLYLFLHQVAPEEVMPPVTRAIVFSFFFSLFLPCGFIVQGLLRRYLRTKYEIYENKIVEWDLLNTDAIYWRNVRGYSYIDGEQFPAIISIELHLKNKKKMLLSVPRGELSEQVVRTLSERCPLMSEDEYRRPASTILTKGEYLYLLAVTLAYSVLGGYLIHEHRLRFLLGYILLLTLILGPGTLGCLLLYGTKTVKDKAVRAYVFLFNFAGLVFLMLFLVLFEFYYWSEVIRKLTEEGVSGGF